MRMCSSTAATMGCITAEVMLLRVHRRGREQCNEWSAGRRLQQGQAVPPLGISSAANTGSV
jgi:hypothetical protein